MNKEEMFYKIKNPIKNMANYYYKCTRDLGIEFEDLYQEGCQAFLEKFESYDEKRASFTTFIYPYLKLYMLRYIKANSTVTLVPYGKYDFARNYSLENNLFYLNYGREKSKEEKLEWIDKEKKKHNLFGNSMKLMLELEKINFCYFKHRVLCIHDLMDNNDHISLGLIEDMGHVDSRGELIADSFNMEEEVVSKIYVENFIHSLSYLTEKESSALIDYLGINDTNACRTLASIARENNLTTQAIEARYQRALNKIQEREKTKLMKNI